MLYNKNMYSKNYELKCTERSLEQAEAQVRYYSQKRQRIIKEMASEAVKAEVVEIVEPDTAQIIPFPLPDNPDVA